MTNVPGVIGRAVHVNGSSWIDVANESHFDHYDKVTVSAWVRVTGGWNSGWQSFVGKAGDWGTGWQLR